MGEVAGSPRPTGQFSPAGGWSIFRSFRGYRLAYVGNDLVAGLTLAAIAIPAQMATAHLGGFPPQIGFFAFIAGTLGFAAFGDNRFLCCGADSTITPIFAGSLALLTTTGSKDYALFAAALALMVGIALIAAGLFRLGRISNLLSIPVLDGFLLGIAAQILISQMPDVLGLNVHSGTAPQRVVEIVTHIRDRSPWTLSIGLGILALLIVSNQISARIPGALIGLVGATLAVVLFDLEKHGVAVLGSVPNVLPRLTIPLPSGVELAQLLPLSLIIAIIVMVQTSATTRSFPSDPGEPPNIDRDLIGAGAGNVLAGFFGAFPVDASPPTTEIVSATGGRSQLACLVAAAIIVLLLTFGTALLFHVPRAGLAGVLLYVALKIIQIDEIVKIYRESRPEFLLIIATAAAIILLPIGEGVAIGILLSLLHGMWSTANAKIIIFERVPRTSIWWPPTPHQSGEKVPGVLVVGFEAPLSFMNAARFRRGLRSILQNAAEKPELVVLEATGISHIDFTAAAGLRQVIHDCHASNVDFAIARLESPRAQEAVRRFGLDVALGPNRIFRSVDEAVKTLASGAAV